MKNILKNRFFVLFVAFLLLAVATRYSPTYSLNDRLITVSCLIEKNGEKYAIVLEAIKPNKTEAEYQEVKGEGMSVELALENIEANSGKKVSFSHCSLILLNSELLADEKIKAFSIKQLKELPEQAIVAVCDTGDNIIGEKLDKGSDSVTLGKAIRESETIDILKTDLNHIGVNYLSYLGANVLPVLTATLTDEKEETYSIKYDGGCCFTKDSFVKLDNEKYLGLLLLISKEKEGKLNFVLDSGERVNIAIQNLQISTAISFRNNSYFAENEVKVTISEDKTHIYDTKGKKIQLDKQLKEAISDKLTSCINEAVSACYNAKIDILRIYDEFYRKYPNLTNKDNFFEKIDIENLLNISVA